MGNESHNQPYVSEEGSAISHEPYTVNGPYNYGVFSPKTPYAFPPNYEDPHLESQGMRPSYAGLGDFGAVDVPGVGTITCAPGYFVDKFFGKIENRLGAGKYFVLPLLSYAKSKMKSALAGAFGAMIQKVNQGESAFRTWFMTNVAYNIEQATNGAASQEMVSVIIPLAFGFARDTLNECKESVAPPVQQQWGTQVQSFIDPSKLPGAVPKDFMMTYTSRIPGPTYYAPAKKSILPIVAVGVAALLLLK
ncbi:MAG: hypothetical protein JRD89_14255 [Deltaproteobacteria bacterium]|nr:hypothetical protein [Deltaproteobacteria bacterium]